MTGLTNHQAARVIAAVAAAYALTPAIITSRSRQKPHVLARREVWRRLVDGGASPTEAGNATGHDHSTVIFGLKAKIRMSFAGVWAALRGQRSTALNNATDKDNTMATQLFQPAPGSAAWFIDTVEKAKGSPHMEVVNLTPALAKYMLASNFDNRNLRSAKVQQYAADMAAGRWTLNGEPLIVANDGKLNDGQHRCLAAIDANATVPVLIVFGVERETRLTVDQGGARTAGDFLGMEGVHNASTSAAIARAVIAYERTAGAGLAGTNYVTSAEVRERVVADTLIGEAATFGQTNSVYSRKFAPGTVIGFAYYVLARVNRSQAGDFLERVCRGDNLGIGTPMHTLREKLLEAGRAPRDRKLALILKAWNFHRRGTKKLAKNLTAQHAAFPGADLMLQHSIRVEDIEIGERHRALSDSAVARLQSSMAEIGLRQPISVRIVEEMILRGDLMAGVPFLVAGAHRLAAAKALGWSHIDCIEVDDDAIKAEMWEIAENLHRLDLTKEQRDDHLRRYAELIEASRAVSPQTAVKLSARGRANEGRPKSIAREVAEATGLSDDTVRRALNPKPVNVVMVREAETDEEAIAREANAIVAAWNRARQAARDLALAQIDEPVFDRTRAAV